MADYLLDADRARDYVRLRYPDWEKEIPLVLLLFLDYKIQGGEGILNLFGEKYSNYFPLNRLVCYDSIPIDFPTLLGFKENEVIPSRHIPGKDSISFRPFADRQFFCNNYFTRLELDKELSFIEEGMRVRYDVLKSFSSLFIRENKIP